MVKRTFLLLGMLLGLVPSMAGAQSVYSGTLDFSGATVRLPKGASDPAACTVADIFVNTTTGAVPKICTAVNTWGLLGIGGSTGATDNAILRADGTGGATLQAGYTSNAPTISDAGVLRLNGATPATQFSELYVNGGVATFNTYTEMLFGFTGGGGQALLLKDIGGAVPVVSASYLGRIGFSSVNANIQAPDTYFTRDSAGVIRVHNGLVVKSTGSGTPTIFEVTPNAATGTGNLVAGTAAGDSLTTGTYNVLLGENAGTALTAGADNNVAIGRGALDGASNATDSNVAIGQDALGTGNNDGDNVAIGNAAGNTTLSQFNTFIGSRAGSAGLNNAGVSGNVAIGRDAMYNATAGDYDYNVAIGFQAGVNLPGVVDDCLMIGRFSTCTVSNTANFGSATAPYASTTTVRSTTGSADVQALNTEAITLSTGGTTTNSSGNIVPANSIIDAIACRVTTTITTATEWGVSITGSAAWNQIGTTDTTVGTMTAGTTAIFVAPDHASQYNASATTITITTTGTPGAGVVRCAVHSRTFTAPTS